MHIILPLSGDDNSSTAIREFAVKFKVNKVDCIVFFFCFDLRGPQNLLQKTTDLHLSHEELTIIFLFPEKSKCRYITLLRQLEEPK